MIHLLIVMQSYSTTRTTHCSLQKIDADPEIAASIGPGQILNIGGVPVDATEVSNSGSVKVTCQLNRPTADSAVSLFGAGEMANSGNGTDNHGSQGVPAHPQQTSPLDMTTASPHPLVSQTIARDQASNKGNAQPVEVDINTIEYQASDSANGPSQPGTRGIFVPGFKSMFKIVIHEPKGDSTTRVAKLDTASAVDVLSKSVADVIGRTIDPYDGEDIAPLGDKIKPLGQITLDWHVMNKGVRTYTTTFLVLDTDRFDALLGEDTIAKIGFYKVNNDVWYLRKA